VTLGYYDPNENILYLYEGEELVENADCYP